jgi:plasmid stabilization system protein ParE
MKVIIRAAAEEDLHRIFDWFKQDNPTAATRMVARIRDRINFLELDSLADMGRAGLEPGTRELIEYPYIIVYEVHRDRGEVEVLTIVRWSAIAQKTKLSGRHRRILRDDITSQSTPSHAPEPAQFPVRLGHDPAGRGAEGGQAAGARHRP